MQAARAAPGEAEPAAARLRLAGQAALPEPAEQSENEMVLVSEGEPETEMTEWGEKMAGRVQDGAGGAEPEGCEGQAGPDCGAEAVSEAVRRLGLAGSATRSVAAEEGGVMGVSVGAKQGPAVYESEEVVEQGPGAGWGAGMLMARPAVELKQRLTLLAAMLATGLTLVVWEEEPGQKHPVPAALGAVLAALAAEQMNPSRSHCPGGWGCWGMCSDYPGQCPWGRCCLRH